MTVVGGGPRGAKRRLETLKQEAAMLSEHAEQSIAEVRAESDAKIAALMGTAAPYVTKSADGQFFVTMTADSYFRQGMQAASWQLHEAVLAIKRAVSHTWLPSGEQRSWRRGTWA